MYKVPSLLNLYIMVMKQTQNGGRGFPLAQFVT